MMDLIAKEQQRQEMQIYLDKQKTKKERNILGQVSTPFKLAKEILEHASNFMLNDQKIKFLDPAFGIGAFYSALISTYDQERIEIASGFEIDPHYGGPALELWQNPLFKLHLEDFTKHPPPVTKSEKYNLVICNPPYTRHHHLKNEKYELQKAVADRLNIKFSGLTGLYGYFLALTHNWMQDDGIAGWLIPSEFMDVNFGKAIKEYLVSRVTLLHIHRFDPEEIQFDNALVTSAVVWFQNRKPSSNHQVRFSFGGSLISPVIEKNISLESLAKEKKWSRFPREEEETIGDYAKLADYFSIKRGIATGNNEFFILSKEKLISLGLPIEQFKPILPSPRYLERDVILAHNNGHPIVERELFVLDSKLSLPEIADLYPKLYHYLQQGLEAEIHKGHLCKSRKIWYSQENRLPSRFYCTYIGRTDKTGKSPFRFISNHSNAIANNSYLFLYPKPMLETILAENESFQDEVAEIMNRITGKALIREGRVYGGGMYKLEPKELANVPSDELKDAIQRLCLLAD